MVLMLATLASGILFQALGQTFRLQHRFGVELFESQQGYMAMDWFRRSVEGLLPDYPDGKDKFTGTAKRFSGLTTNSLSGDYGVPSGFSWELVFDPTSGSTRLVYNDGKQAVPILSSPGNVGRFVYVDARGGTHETWPPPLGQWPQLPQALRLEGWHERQPVLTMVPMGPAEPPPRIRDIMGARQ